MMKDYNGSLKDINSAITLDSTQSIYFRERGLIKNKLVDYLGIDTIEISDGSIFINHEEKCHLINEYSKNYRVLDILLLC